MTDERLRGHLNVPPQQYAEGREMHPIDTIASEVSLKGLLGDDRKPVYPADDPIDEHDHKWKAAGIERRFLNGPTSVVQSCECGEVRRVEVP